ncbi:MAG: hypothetical protein ACLQBB_00305, partial [Solirubrobacteraceae bacterium]
AGDRYVFKGDNNNFIDFEHPARSQLIGSLWIHIPGAGATLDSLRSPALIGGLLSFGALLLMGAAFVRRRRLHGRQRRAASAPLRLPAPLANRDPGQALAVVALGLLAITPFFVLALIAFTRPSASLAPVKLPYKQEGTLSYSADASPGPTYQAGRAVTGDPLFTHVLSSVDFSYSYRFHSAAAHSLAGRATLDASISSTSGWQTTLPLGGPTYFRGDRAVVNGLLDIAALNALLHRVEATTAVSGVYTMDVTPHVVVGGSLGVVPVHASFSSSVPFSVNHLEIRPVVTAGASASANAGRPPASAFSTSLRGATSGRRYQSQELALGFTRMTVSAARAIAIGAILLITLAIALGLYFVRPRRRGQAEAIRSRYGALIVPVARVWQQPGVSVIDVEDIESLVRIAEHYERSILFEVTEYGEAFWVTDESGQFRFVADPAEQVVLDDAPEFVAEPAYGPPDATADQEIAPLLDVAPPARATPVQPLEVAPSPAPAVEPAYAVPDQIAEPAYAVPDQIAEPAPAPGVEVAEPAPAPAVEVAEPTPAPAVEIVAPAPATAAEPTVAERIYAAAEQAAGQPFGPDVPVAEPSLTAYVQAGQPAGEAHTDHGEIYAAALGAGAGSTPTEHAAAPEPGRSPEAAERLLDAEQIPVASQLPARGWPRAQTYAGRRV